MRILMPVDGSECSKAAVAFAASRATLLKNPAEIELVNVQQPVPPRVARALGKEIVQAHYDAESGKALKTAAAALRRAGANTTARYVVGSVPRELATLVASDPADLIVMGSHGETGLKELLLGSAASTVAVSCTRPLLVLRGGTLPRRDSLRVGIALDGSPHGLAAARFVAEHRDLFGPAPSVSLIHVVPDLTKITVPGWIEREVATGIRPEQARSMQEAAFESAFKPARDELAHAGIAVTELRLVGHLPADLIAAQAVEGRLDLLVMGSTGFGRARYLPMGSVAARVAARCPTALLLVRDKQGPRAAETVPAEGVAAI